MSSQERLPDSLHRHQMQYEAQQGKTETVWNRLRAGFWATKRKKAKAKGGIERWHKRQKEE